MKTNSKTEQVLVVLIVLSWLAFIGLIVKSGVILFSFISSIFNSESARNIHEGLDLFNLRQDNFTLYTILIVFTIIMSVLNAIVWWMVIKLINKIKLANPFAMEVAHRLEYISYTLFSVWVLSVTGGGFIAWLGDKAGNLNDSWSHGQFLFMAGLVFIISQIFKRGVEIQSENDLTV